MGENTHRIQFHSLFQASTGGLRMYSLDKGTAVHRKQCQQTDVVYVRDPVFKGCCTVVWPYI